MEDTKALIDPEHELSNGALAANALVGLVKKAGLARKFGGEKEHLFYEAWQALAKFHNCSIKTLDAIPVEINGIQGAKARAEVIDDSTGKVVGGAEAYCLRDEKNWANKPWFQLASMAQTRAGSKASRNKWAFIPVMVGYAATPAEEMDEVHENGKNKPKTASQDAPKQEISGEAISNPTVTTGISNITFKEGKNKDNKPYTRYAIHVGDTIYTTFSKTIAENAKKAKEGNLETTIEFKEGKFGLDIISLVVHEPPEPGSEKE